LLRNPAFLFLPVAVLPLAFSGLFFYFGNRKTLAKAWFCSAKPGAQHLAMGTLF
jgi:hypothetical protein